MRLLVLSLITIVASFPVHGENRPLVEDNIVSKWGIAP